MTTRLAPFAVIASVLLLAACGDAPREPDAAPTPPSAGAASAQDVATTAPPATETPDPPGTLVGAKGLIKADPGSVACHPRSKVMIRWNATRTEEGAPQIAIVRVLVGEPGRDFTLFSEGGAQGYQETGAWVKPGVEFRLMDGRTSGEELDRIVIEGGPCEDTGPRGSGQNKPGQ